jgi:heterodisulfide reductase subunit C
MDRLKECRTVWVCSSCQTCVTRCPNDVDLPRLMDWIKENIVLEGKPAAEDKIKIFHQAFLKEVKARGRVFEGGLMLRYMLESGSAFGPEAFKNAKMGLTMLRKGRLKLLPGGTKDRKWLKELVRETSRK